MVMIEYTGSNLKHFLLHQCIIHQLSCAYTPEQNGQPERKNRLMLDTTRTLLHDVNISLYFWAEIRLTSNYLKNELLTTTCNLQTPIQLSIATFPLTLI